MWMLFDMTGVLWIDELILCLFEASPFEANVYTFHLKATAAQHLDLINLFHYWQYRCSTI